MSYGPIRSTGAASASRSLSRNWCFTCNNPSQFPLTEIHQLPALPEHCKYLCIGNETGESGTPHYQGYVQFKTEKSFAQVLKWVETVTGIKGHIEKANGTPAEAAAYCRKDGAFVEFGSPPMDQQAKGVASKELFNEIISLAECGKLDDVKERYPKIFLSHYNSLQRISVSKLKRPDDLLECQVYYLYGRPGVGKSQLARNLGGDYFDKALNKWWTGYDGQPIAIIEELDGPSGKIMQQHLKRWTDRYAFLAQVHCGVCWIRPAWIVITSNYTLEEVFDTDPTCCAAMRRRCAVHEVTVENRTVLRESIAARIASVSSQVEASERSDLEMP